MYEYLIGDPVGHTKSGENPLAGTLLLLDDYGTVLAAVGEAPLSRGSDFFLAIDPSGAERAFFARCGERVGDEAVLLQGKRPFILFRVLLHRARLIPAYLPPADQDALFSRAAFFADSFPKLHFAPSVLSSRAALTEKEFTAINGSYRPLFEAFSFDRRSLTRAGERLTALLRRLIALADLAGVDLSYDLTGLSFASLENPDEEWICAASLAWFLEARSFSKDKHVRVIGEQMLSLGSMLAMGFESDDKAPSAAFEEFFRAERERGNAVEITREGDTLLLTFPLAHPEFSLEGGKQRPAAFSITKYINLPIPEEK